MARLLSRGSSGLDVSELQAALNFHIRGPAKPLATDGKFGPLTDARVREFQRKAGIKVDGMVGPETIRALYRTVFGVIEAILKPTKTGPAVAPIRQPAAAAGGSRFGLVAGMPRLSQVRTPIPDFVPPSQRVPQSRTAVSQGYDVEAKVVFDPMADGQDGEHPLRLTLSPTLPWPVFLPTPLQLDIESLNPGVGRFQLAGKIKVPFTLVQTKRVELSPYFFAGAGATQNHFKDLNAGAGAKLKLKMFQNIAGSGVSLGMEADGGGKFNWDKDTGKTTFKEFFEGSVFLEKRF